MHDKICFCLRSEGERNYDVWVSGVSAGGRGVAAFSVPEQPHTDKPFLRPPEMMLGDEGGWVGGGGEGQDEGVGRRVIYQQQQQTCRQTGSYCS